MKRLLMASLVVSLAIGCANGQVEGLESQVAALEDQVEQLRYALKQANENIEQAANDIADAQLYVGECESLESAVEMMNEPSTVAEP